MLITILFGVNLTFFMQLYTNPAPIALSAIWKSITTIKLPVRHTNKSEHNVLPSRCLFTKNNFYLMEKVYNLANFSVKFSTSNLIGPLAKYKSINSNKILIAFFLFQM